MSDHDPSELHQDDPPPWELTPAELRAYGPHGADEGDYAHLVFSGLYRNPFSAVMAAANASALARGEPGAVTRDMVNLLEDYVESAAHALETRPEEDDAVRRAIAVLRALVSIS